MPNAIVAKSDRSLKQIPNDISLRFSASFKYKMKQVLLIRYVGAKDLMVSPGKVNLPPLYSHPFPASVVTVATSGSFRGL